MGFVALLAIAAIAIGVWAARRAMAGVRIDDPHGPHVWYTPVSTLRRAAASHAFGTRVAALHAEERIFEIPAAGRLDLDDVVTWRALAAGNESYGHAWPDGCGTLPVREHLLRLDGSGYGSDTLDAAALEFASALDLRTFTGRIPVAGPRRLVHRDVPTLTQQAIEH